MPFNSVNDIESCKLCFCSAFPPAAERCALMGVELIIYHLRFCRSSAPSKLPEQIFPDAASWFFDARDGPPEPTRRTACGPGIPIGRGGTESFGARCMTGEVGGSARCGGPQRALSVITHL